jgi:hypothetical protein
LAVRLTAKYSHPRGRVQARATIGLNWVWIGIALTVPLAAGLIAALPFWWRLSDALLYAIYGGIGFAEVMGVFTIGLAIEERARRRRRAPEWR